MKNIPTLSKRKDLIDFLLDKSFKKIFIITEITRFINQVYINFKFKKN